MEVVVPRQELSKDQHTEDKLEFSRCSKIYGKREAEEIHDYGNKEPELEGEKTKGLLKKSNTGRVEVTVTQGERLNQQTNNKPDKILKCMKGSGTSKKRMAQEIFKRDDAKPNSEAKEVCSKRTTKLPPMKDDSKKLTAPKRKRKFDDDLLINDLEDEEMLALLKSKTRSRARRMDNVMMTFFLSAYFLH